MDLKSKLGSIAGDVGKQNDILPAFIMAVAILETGNGSSLLCNRANNLFSIKGSYQGKSIVLNTTEYLSGKEVKIPQEFKVYPSFRESLQDFCDLIKNGVTWNRSIYKNAVIGIHDLTQVIVNFGHTPYMTDPAYSSKLIGIVKSYGLESYDQNFFKKTYTSIVDYLKDHGLDSSFESRMRLARSHHIPDYQGTAVQNLQLLNQLQGGK